jgi:hypothetical protein
MTTFDLAAAAYRMGAQYLRNICADLTPEEFQHQPVPGTNSAAWIVGHLTLSVRRAAERYGATDVPPLKDDFVERFKATRQQAGNQTNLGSKEELFAAFDVMVEKAMEAIRKLPPETLTAPPPTPAPAVVKSSGEMLFFGAMHITLHCGQISTIRRSLGKPPLV